MGKEGGQAALGAGGAAFDGAQGGGEDLSDLGVGVAVVVGQLQDCSFIGVELVQGLADGLGGQFLVTEHAVGSGEHRPGVGLVHLWQCGLVAAAEPDFQGGRVGACRHGVHLTGRPPARRYPLHW
jgi:hypothetical protein